MNASTVEPATLYPAFASYLSEVDKQLRFLPAEHRRIIGLEVGRGLFEQNIDLEGSPGGTPAGMVHLGFDNPRVVGKRLCKVHRRFHFRLLLVGCFLGTSIMLAALYLHVAVALGSCDAPRSVWPLTLSVLILAHLVGRYLYDMAWPEPQEPLEIAWYSLSTFGFYAFMSASVLLMGITGPAVIDPSRPWASAVNYIGGCGLGAGCIAGCWSLVRRLARRLDRRLRVVRLSRPAYREIGRSPD